MVTDADVETFATRSTEEGPEFYARNLAKLRKDVLTSFEVGKLTVTTRFGLKRTTGLPRFLHNVFASVYNIDGSLRHDVSVDAVACLNQLTAVFSKVRGGHTPESDKAVIESFVKTEEEMATFRINESQAVFKWTAVNGTSVKRVPTPLGEILDEARRLVRRVLAGSDPREISPKHGSGASACSTPKWARYGGPRYVEKIDRIWPMSEYYYASAAAFCDGLEQYLGAPEFDPSAKVLLVPKDARGQRLISCEPKETMWIQQGLMSKLYEDIEGASLTQGLVNFTEPGFNQYAAWRGSLTGTLPPLSSKPPSGSSWLDATASARRDADTSYMIDITERLLTRKGGRRTVSALMEGHVATIDLKDASDRLSMRLVERLFPVNWSSALSACRSEFTRLPDGRLITLSKHAPMGSAVCFPVMALTIWAVLTAIAPRSAARQILVYGDDIVVPTFMVDDAIRVLESVGLVVNTQKSFSKGPFRESCGEEYYFGARVRPVYLRCMPDNDTASKMQLLAFANNLLAAPNIADNGWMLDLLEEWYGGFHPVIPTTERARSDWKRESASLGLSTTVRDVTFSGVAYTDDHSRVSLPSGRRTRWDDALQKRAFLIRVPVPQYHEYDTGDWCHVLRSLVEPGERSLGADAVHNRVRFLYRWCYLA
jgi:hypothetical protein